jgi:hypothetical protein
MEGFPTPSPRTPADVITGSRGPENYNSEQVKVEMQDEIVSYMPNAYPLQTLTNRLKGTDRVENYRFDWIEDDEQPREIVLTGQALPADTTLDCAAGDEARVAAGYLLQCVETRELVRVASAPTSGSITVVRAIGGDQSTLEAGYHLVFLATAAEDGAAAGVLKSNKKFPKYNYCQIIRTPYGYTRRGGKTGLYGGKDPAYLKKKAGAEHAKSVELCMFFGKRDYKSGDNHLITFMGGLESQIKTNVWDVSRSDGRFGEDSFDEFCEELFRWGEGGSQQGMGKKYLFASSRLVTRINWFAKQRLQYRILDESIGFRALEYTSPHGDILILKTPILDYHHNGGGFFLDMNHVDKKVFGGDDMVHRDGIQSPDVDGTTNEYLSDVGLQVELECSHAIIKGVA